MSGLTLTADATAVRRARGSLLVTALVGVAAVAGWALLRGPEPLVGYGMPAPPRTWLLGAAPALRLLVTTTGGACLGMLAGVALRPDVDDRVLARAGVLAAAWTGAAFLGSVVLVVAALGRGGPATLGRPAALLDAMVTFGEPAAMLVAAVVGAVLTTAIGLGARVRPGLVALAAVGVLAPAVTGPTTRTGAGHDLVTDAAVFAALAGGVWLGSSVLDDAVGPGTGRPQRRTAVTAGAVTLAATAVGAAVLVRGEWWASLHGRWAALQVLLLGLALLLVVRRARPVLVAVVLLVAATAGALAVVEPPPLRLLPATMQQMMVGFDVPAPPTVLGLLLPGRPDLLWAVVGTALAVGYLLLRRRVEDWPRARLVSWLAGCALLVGTTSSTLGSLSMALFSAHMVVHVVLSTLVPVLLAGGGPLTLLARARPDGGSRVRSVLDGPGLRWATHPLVSLTVFAGSMFVLYLTPLFPAVLPSHWAHQVLAAVVLVSGYLFLWPVVGVDPAPRPLPHVARLALLLASMPFHAAFAVALLGVTEVIGATYYLRLEVGWVTDLRADQRLGALLGWGAAEGALLVVLLLVLARWAREDRPGRDTAGTPWGSMVAELARQR